MLKLVAFALIMVIGQLSFKRVAIEIAHVSGIGPIIRHLALSPWFLIALALYGVATILWVLALRETPLSRAYVFVALAFALVPIGAAVFFHEVLGLRYVVGLLLIITGIVIIGSDGDLTRSSLDESRKAT